MPIIFVWRIPARGENYQVGEDVIKTTFTSNYTQWTDNTVKPRQKKFFVMRPRLHEFQFWHILVQQRSK